MTRIGVLLAACLGAAAVFRPVAAAAQDDPVAIVRSIYVQYDEGGARFDVPETYFTEGLLALWREVEAGADGDVERALGFAVFTASDKEDVIDIDDVRLQLLAEKYVIASYVSIEEREGRLYSVRRYFQYNFENTKDGWKIGDIDWGRDKNTLRGSLMEIMAIRALR